METSGTGSLPTAPAVVRPPGGETMRAIVLEKFGGLDSLVYDIPKPLPKYGEVVIKVAGFGINHAELHMRQGNGPKQPKSAASMSASSTRVRAESSRSAPRSPH